MRNQRQNPFGPAGVNPAAVPPATGVAPTTPTAPVSPTGVGPLPYPTGVPTNVAPVRRIVHPTRVMERHTVTRYPVENVYPSHTRNVHHNVCEYYCSYPHTESNHVSNHTVNHCCPPPRRRFC